jgi:hypothetical protein
MKNWFLILVAMFVSLAFSVQANEQPGYEVAYRAGNYLEAVRLGEADGRADALVLAARARLARIDLGVSDNRKADAKAAILDAEKAMVLDPKNAEAHLMKVAAFGILARGMSKMKSLRKGMAGKSRKHIEAALVLDPSSAWARAMLGMWHLEIVRRGGSFGARMTGANAKDGATACATALKSDNYDTGLGTQCALALLICKQNYEPAALIALRQASQSDVKGIAYNRAMQGRANEILDLIEDEGMMAARKRATEYLNYTAPPVEPPVKCNAC